MGMSACVSFNAGVRLAGVTEKLTGVTDGGRRGAQLSVVTEKLTRVTDGAPEKGRRGHTFTHTERASVATIYLSDRMHRICGAYTKHMHI
jgi:hypothetical protein